MQLDVNLHAALCPNLSCPTNPVHRVVEKGLGLVMKDKCASTALILHEAACGSLDPSLRLKAVILKLVAVIKDILTKVAKKVISLLEDELTHQLDYLMKRLGQAVPSGAQHARNFNLNLTIFKKFGMELADRERQKLEIQETNAQLVTAGQQLEQLLDPDQVIGFQREWVQ